RWTTTRRSTSTPSERPRTRGACPSLPQQREACFRCEDLPPRGDDRIRRLPCVGARLDPLVDALAQDAHASDGRQAGLLGNALWAEGEQAERFPCLGQGTLQVAESRHQVTPLFRTSFPSSYGNRRSFRGSEPWGPGGDGLIPPVRTPARAENRFGESSARKRLPRSVSFTTFT